MKSICRNLVARCARPRSGQCLFVRGVVVAVLVLGSNACLYGDASKPHAVIVVGTHHYSPERTMPKLADVLKLSGFGVTVLLPDGDPEDNANGTGVQGLEALDQADVAIFFMRFLALEDEQFAAIERYVQSGRPVVGLRTSTHAFRYPQEHPRFEWNIKFGRDVLGTRYVAHQSGTTECRVVSSQSDHPILSGVGPEHFLSGGSLYLTALQPGCVPLVLGTGKRDRPRLIEGPFGTFYLPQTATDIVAWTWVNRYGATVFGTSLGHEADFAGTATMQVILNGIRWSVGLDPIGVEGASPPF
jgi:type 1 glutamine amidotransferase